MHDTMNVTDVSGALKTNITGQFTIGIFSPPQKKQKKSDVIKNLS